MEHEDGACRVYDILGRRVRVSDSYRNALKIARLAADPLFSDTEKLAVMMRICLPDPERFSEAFGDSSVEAFKEVLWQAFRFDVDGTRSRPEKQLIDPDQDAARIRVTMRQAYGYGREFEELPYRDVCEMIGMSPHETPMGQALYYRTARPPKSNKYNREQVEAFRKARRFYRLHHYLEH